MFPLVTAIVPAYNCAPWVAAAVRSVLAQTYTPIEILVVDDGSTDGTDEVVRSFGSSVRYIRQANAGVSRARNRGAAGSRGEFLAFLDADDEWLPRKTEVQVERLLNRPEVGVSFMSMLQVDDSIGLKTEIRYAHHEDLVKSLLLGSCVVGSNSSVMIRRGVFENCGGYDPAFSQCADWDLWLRLAGGGPADIVEEPLAVYRTHGLNMSRNSVLLERDTFRTLDKFFGVPSNAARYNPLRRRAYSNHHLICAGTHLHAANFGASLRSLGLACLLYPPHLLRALGTPARIARRFLDSTLGA